MKTALTLLLSLSMHTPAHAGWLREKLITREHRALAHSLRVPTEAYQELHDRLDRVAADAEFREGGHQFAACKILLDGLAHLATLSDASWGISRDLRAQELAIRLQWFLTKLPPDEVSVTPPDLQIAKTYRLLIRLVNEAIDKGVRRPATRRAILSELRAELLRLIQSETAPARKWWDRRSSVSPEALNPAVARAIATILADTWQDECGRGLIDGAPVSNAPAGH